MKQSKLSIFAMLAMAVMSSCSNDNELSSTNSEYVNSVRVTVEDFQQEGAQTRTAYTVDGSGFHFSWVEGDALGIYPVGGDQVKFPISNGDGSATATFDGGAWKLRSEYKYAAYYPFSVDNYKIDQKALPVSFTGQTQNGNGSTAHLGAYDYLACAATAPDANGGVDLSMKHLGAFLRLQLTMPKADTYSSVTLESNGAKFVTSGTFDLTAATPAIKTKTTSSTFTINLTNLSTTKENQVITIYALVAPADLSTCNITINVQGAGTTNYVKTIQGKNFEAKKAYSLIVDEFTSGTFMNGKENGHEWVDLGLPSGTKWATMNIGSSKETDSGLYFAWGETTQQSNLSFRWSSYKWTSDGTEYGITKYTTPDTNYNGIWYDGDVFIGDNKTTLELEDDAAYVNWGGTWRMPTQEEFVELYNECSCTEVTLGGVKGFKIVGKNGNYIFLPAAGQRYNGSRGSYGTYGYYWSSSVKKDLCRTALNLSFAGQYFSGYSCFDRSRGMPIRPVCNK